MADPPAADAAAGALDEEPDAAGGDEDDEDDAALATAEVPFGPYLAIAAMFYLFAEPWVRINVAWLGG